MAAPKILLSNDDGIEAAGLRALADRLRAEAEVWIAAPDREQSATSHSISLHKPLRIRKHTEREFSVDGTPSDSVYLGLHHLMPEPPDIVVSGINHGPNLGNDVLYSGTVSAAMEGALFGYRALAVSLCMGNHAEAPPEPRTFETAAEVAAGIVRSVLARPMPLGVVLNVNVPHIPRERIRGMKLCRLGYTDWADAVTARRDPRGKPYYWIGGDRAGTDEIPDSDNNAIAGDFISLTPIHYDLTDYRAFAFTREIEVPGFERSPDQLGDAPLGHPVHPRGRRPRR